MRPELTRAEILAALSRMGYREIRELKRFCRDYERQRVEGEGAPERPGARRPEGAAWLLG